MTNVKFLLILLTLFWIKHEGWEKKMGHQVKKMQIGKMMDQAEFFFHKSKQWNNSWKEGWKKWKPQSRWKISGNSGSWGNVSVSFSLTEHIIFEVFPAKVCLPKRKAISFAYAPCVGSAKSLICGCINVQFCPPNCLCAQFPFSYHSIRVRSTTFFAICKLLFSHLMISSRGSN